MLTVVVHEKGGQTQRFSFKADSFSIGREDDNDLVLDRVNVSKHHLRFQRVGGHVEVIDLESTNGTYLNGRKVQSPRTVRRTDRVYVGDYILMLEGDDALLASAQAATDDKKRKAGGKSDLVELVADDTGLMTSAQRVAAAGVESSYLDGLAAQIHQTLLKAIPRLDPLQANDISDDERKEALELIDGILDDFRDSQQIEAAVDIGPFRERIVREAIEWGPLGDLMRDDTVREIQVVGINAVHVIRDSGTSERLDLRFTGEAALLRAIQRMTRKRGVWTDGSQVIEGIVDHGFFLYALIPPHPARQLVVSLRRMRTDANNLTALVQEGVLSADMRELLVLALKACRRVLVCASGGVNLDRFMRALIGEIPESLRVACISDSGRLGMKKGWVQVRRLVEQGDKLELQHVLGVLLRGGLDLVISQQCGHADAAAVIDALAGASRGVVVSTWGINTAHALSRLAALGTVSGGAVQGLTLSLAHAIDLVVRLNSGVNLESMQVLELNEPNTRADGTIEYRPLFTASKGEDGTTEFKSTPHVPDFLRRLAEQGAEVPQRLLALGGAPATAS
ncbi:MAG: Flp pilus assembly complex ATPase component TadA [Myxococcales bacterium]|nr:Flp pilus assembly complex ATPase component TadA [Myxococcales bacterium]